MDKAKTKSKSMEEISKIPTNNNNDLARAHAARLSLPSQSHGKKRIHPVLSVVGTIDEEDDDSFRMQIDGETEEPGRGRRDSQPSKRSHRSRAGSASSKSDRIRKESSSSSRHKRDYGGYENRAYDSNLDGISVISRSSTRASSVQSLEVQREQYCCFTKWSPFERKLAALVAILITIILLLVITIVVLATGNKINSENPTTKMLLHNILIPSSS